MAAPRERGVERANKRIKDGGNPGGRREIAWKSRASSEKGREEGGQDQGQGRPVSNPLLEGESYPLWEELGSSLPGITRR